MLRAAIAVVVGLATLPSYAQVLKCVGASGKIEYRNSPCPAATQADAVDAQKAADETGTGGERRSAGGPRARNRAAQDAVERQAAIARAARPQTSVAAIPPPPGK